MLKEKKFHKEERNARVVFNQSQQIMEPQLYHPELELVCAHRSRLESSMQHLVNRLLFVLVCSAVILFVLVISCSRLLEG